MPAIRPPSAIEPVSPMKICAGEAFHHRKPKQAPIADGGHHRQVERIAHLVAAGATGSVPQGLRNWMNEISVYAPNTIAAAPAASPSRPSVRFTAFDVAATMRYARTTKPTDAEAELRDVAHEGQVRRGRGQAEAVAELQRQHARTRPPTTSWPPNLARARRPRLRCRRILMKSSRKPTTPSPTIRNSSSSPDAVGPPPPPDRDRPGARRRSRRTVEPMIATPPIVGVPRLTRWVCGPSSRISWPKPVPAEERTTSGVTQDRDEQRDDGGDQDRLHACARPPRPCRLRPSPAGSADRRRAPSATRSRPAAREAFTSTTSPGRSSSRSSAIAASTSGTQLGLAVPRAFQSGAVLDRPGRLADGDEP